MGGESVITESNQRLDLVVELGLRLPTLPGPTTRINEILYRCFFRGRLEAFIDDFIPITFFGNVLYNPEQDVLFRFRAGAVYSIYTGEFDNFQNEVHFLYRAQAKYKSSMVDGILGITGRKKINGQ